MSKNDFYKLTNFTARFARDAENAENNNIFFVVERTTKKKLNRYTKECLQGAVFIVFCPLNRKQYRNSSALSASLAKRAVKKSGFAVLRRDKSGFVRLRRDKQDNLIFGAI